MLNYAHTDASVFSLLSLLPFPIGIAANCYLQENGSDDNCNHKFRDYWYLPFNGCIDIVFIAYFILIISMLSFRAHSFYMNWHKCIHRLHSKRVTQKIARKLQRRVYGSCAIDLNTQKHRIWSILCSQTQPYARRCIAFQRLLRHRKRRENNVKQYIFHRKFPFEWKTFYSSACLNFFSVLSFCSVCFLLDFISHNGIDRRPILRSPCFLRRFVCSGTTSTLSFKSK